MKVLCATLLGLASAIADGQSCVPGAVEACEARSCCGFALYELADPVLTDAATNTLLPMCWRVPQPYEDMPGNSTDAIVPADYTYTIAETDVSWSDLADATVITNGNGAEIPGYTFYCKASYLSAGLGALALSAFL